MKSPACGSSDQVSRLRSCRSRVKLRAASSSNIARARRERASVDVDRLERVVRHTLIELERIDPHECRVEARVDGLAPREDADLAALGRPASG
jgi:hypothetical protein